MYYHRQETQLMSIHFLAIIAEPALTIDTVQHQFKVFCKHNFYDFAGKHE